MAKFKMQAGATLDTLTQPELDRSLTRFITSWRKETTRGVNFRRLSRFGTADASGNVRIGGTDSAVPGLGPEPGFVWSVSRLAVANLLGTAICTVSINNDDSSSLVRTGFTLANNALYHEFGGPGLILRPNDILLFTATGVTAGTPVVLTAQATEVPFNQAWELV